MTPDSLLPLPESVAVSDRSYADVITKSSRMDRLPNYLSYRVLKCDVIKKINLCLPSSELQGFVFPDASVLLLGISGQLAFILV